MATALWNPSRDISFVRDEASFKDGVLELRLPKSEAAKPKRIMITGAEEEASKAGPGPKA